MFFLVICVHTCTRARVRVCMGWGWGVGGWYVCVCVTTTKCSSYLGGIPFELFSTMIVKQLHFVLLFLVAVVLLLL